MSILSYFTLSLVSQLVIMLTMPMHGGHTHGEYVFHCIDSRRNVHPLHYYHGLTKGEKVQVSPLLDY